VSQKDKKATASMERKGRKQREAKIGEKGGAVLFPGKEKGGGSTGLWEYSRTGRLEWGNEESRWTTGK